MKRCIAVILSAVSLVMLLMAAALLVAAIAKPDWLVLPNVDSGMGVNQKATYYSGLFEFCGDTPGQDNFVNEYFCLPAEISQTTATTDVIKMNAFKGAWRTTTQTLAFCSLAMVVVTLIMNSIAICACCGKTGVKCFYLVWVLLVFLTVMLTVATMIYFVVTFQSDSQKMFYTVAATAYERNLSTSFYLTAASAGTQFVSLILAGIVSGITLKSFKGSSGSSTTVSAGYRAGRAV